VIHVCVGDIFESSNSLLNTLFPLTDKVLAKMLVVALQNCTMPKLSKEQEILAKQRQLATMMHVSGAPPTSARSLDDATTPQQQQQQQSSTKQHHFL
jgi:hypothetical protein